MEELAALSGAMHDVAVKSRIVLSWRFAVEEGISCCMNVIQIRRGCSAAAVVLEFWGGKRRAFQNC